MNPDGTITRVPANEATITRPLLVIHPPIDTRTFVAVIDALKDSYPDAVIGECPEHGEPFAVIITEPYQS